MPQREDIHLCIFGGRQSPCGPSLKTSGRLHTFIKRWTFKDCVITDCKLVRCISRGWIFLMVVLTRPPSHTFNCCRMLQHVSQQEHATQSTSRKCWIYIAPFYLNSNQSASQCCLMHPFTLAISHRWPRSLCKVPSCEHTLPHSHTDGTASGVHPCLD